MKLTPNQQATIIPNDDIRMAFLRRPDIASLDAEEQEKRWQEHLKAVNHFREFLSDKESFVT